MDITVAQVLIFALGIAYFWLAVFAAIALVAALRVMRLRRIASVPAITADPQPAPPDPEAVPAEAKATREVPAIKRETRESYVLTPLKEKDSDSEMVVLEIAPDSEPLHTNREMQSIVKNRRAPLATSAHSQDTRPAAS
jgi:hypothetical protein